MHRNWGRAAQRDEFGVRGPVSDALAGPSGGVPTVFSIYVTKFEHWRMALSVTGLETDARNCFSAPKYSTRCSI